MTKNRTYASRLVLFVDFLAFKEHIEQTQRDPSHVARMSRALSLLAEVGEREDGFKSKRATQFSDCLVVSYKVTERSAVFWLLDAIATQLVILAERGFLVRGAITVGEMFHSRKQVFGPALVEAYRLESQVADVPRVLVDASVFQVARQSRAPHHTEQEELKYADSFLANDADGNKFLDYVSWNAVVDAVGADDELYPRYLDNLVRLTAAGLNHSIPKVAGKYVWLQRQLKMAIEKFKGLPSDHPYRIQNPENCWYIESLDDLSTLAAKIDSSHLPEWLRNSEGEKQ
jgi:hypothetical protein